MGGETAGARPHRARQFVQADRLTRWYGCRKAKRSATDGRDQPTGAYPADFLLALILV